MAGVKVFGRLICVSTEETDSVVQSEGGAATTPQRRVGLYLFAMAAKRIQLLLFLLL